MGSRNMATDNGSNAAFNMQIDEEEAEINNGNKTVSIIGTGDYARALAHRLVHIGYSVVCGSRYPGKRSLTARDKTLDKVAVTSIEEALSQSNIIFLAIPAKHSISSLQPHSAALSEKILVDISNGKSRRRKRSNAEALAEAFLYCHVVKAFNTVSAYSLVSGLNGGGQTVQVAGNDPHAREAVADVARDMGFGVTMAGGLTAARQLEIAPLKLFRGWGLPLIVSTLIWSGWMAYATWSYHTQKGYPWRRWPTNTMNKIMGCSSVTLLSLTYLPGCIASIVQLINGTKYKRFPSWLDRWMIMRKQLGLIALWLACVHCILSVANLSPVYFRKWYDVEAVYIASGHTEDIVITEGAPMRWDGETAILLGTLSLAFLAVLGITSLPSVGSKLNWRQWTFVQSYLGNVALLLAGAHICIIVMPSFLKRLDYWMEPAQDTSFIALCFLVFVLLLRVTLLLPCFSVPVHIIRNGWERTCC